mgnify:CR=1 FL=1
MDIEFIRERITQLRLQKGVSEYKMSYDLGHSRGYINNISSALYDGIFGDLRVFRHYADRVF